MPVAGGGGHGQDRASRRGRGSRPPRPRWPRSGRRGPRGRPPPSLGARRSVDVGPHPARAPPGSRCGRARRRRRATVTSLPGHEAAGHHPEGGLGRVAGHGRGRGAARRDGRSRTDPARAPAARRSMSAPAAASISSVWARVAHRLAHHRLARRRRARPAGSPTSPGRWPPAASTRCPRSAPPSTVSGGRHRSPRPSTVGAHGPQRLGDPVHRAGPRASRRPTSTVSPGQAGHHARPGGACRCPSCRSRSAPAGACRRSGRPSTRPRSPVVGRPSAPRAAHGRRGPGDVVAVGEAPDHASSPRPARPGAGPGARSTCPRACAPSPASGAARRRSATARVTRRGCRSRELAARWPGSPRPVDGVAQPGRPRSASTTSSSTPRGPSAEWAISMS